MMTDLKTSDRAQALTELLRRTGELASGESVTDVVQVDGGWSRSTYLATARTEGGNRTVVVRAETGAGLTGAGLEWEYGVYRDLHMLDAVPRVLALEADVENPFGGPYFIMSFLPGEAPNLWKAAAHGPLQANWAGSRTIARDFVRNLAEIHLIDRNAAPPSLEQLDFDGLVDRWTAAYEKSRLARDPILEEAIAWLRSSQPEPGRIGLVHGDYRLGNLLIDDDYVAGVLDWELAHVGDVNYDLGYVSLDYVAGRHLRRKTELLAGVADADWFFAQYATMTGDEIDRKAIAVWSALSLVALIVMAMIGFQAFERGLTTDLRRIWSRCALPGLRRELTERVGW